MKQRVKITHKKDTKQQQQQDYLHILKECQNALYSLRETNTHHYMCILTECIMCSLTGVKKKKKS